MSKANLLHFLVLILFTTNSYFCIAKNISVQQCDELASCGDIHNISYPFRLKGQPEECGEPNYELTCENNKTVIIYIRGVRYYVQSLSRENLTIRLVDSLVQRDNCSSPPHPLNFTAAYDLSSELDKLIKDQLFYVDYSKNRQIIFLSCEKPLSNSSLFIDTKPCINGSVLSTKKLGKYYSYVTTEDAEVSDLEESCSIDQVAMSAKPVKCGSNCSYLEFHDSLAYGFELSWDVIACQKYCNGKTCHLRDGGNTIYQCGTNYCPFPCEFSVPLSKSLVHKIKLIKESQNL